jgi:hypothetical protein
MSQPLKMQIENIIREHGYTTSEAASAILSLIRAHLATEEVVENANNKYWTIAPANAEDSNYVLDRDAMRTALAAALGDDQ